MQLETPRSATEIVVTARYETVEIVDVYVKPRQMITSVKSLSERDTYEGALTFAEDDRSLDHVDGGLVILDKADPPPACSWIQTPHPRLLMALMLDYLFPKWADSEPRIHLSPGVRIGDRTSIGHPGFGVVWYQGRYEGKWLRFPQLGEVFVGMGTTIGCGCTIPRGALTHTIIGRDVHIDDQVHIAHGCHIGDHTIIAANAMLAGSVTVEDSVWIGPSASIMQGVTIGTGATIGLGAVVLEDVKPGETIVGHHRVIRTQAIQRGVTR